MGELEGGWGEPTISVSHCCLISECESTQLPQYLQSVKTADSHSLADKEQCYNNYYYSIVPCQLNCAQMSYFAVGYSISLAC